jgi:hypothetical protein
MILLTLWSKHSQPNADKPIALSDEDRSVSYLCVYNSNKLYITYFLYIYNSFLVVCPLIFSIFSRLSNSKHTNRTFLTTIFLQILFSSILRITVRLSTASTPKSDQSWNFGYFSFLINALFLFYSPMLIKSLYQNSTTRKLIHKFQNSSLNVPSFGSTSKDTLQQIRYRSKNRTSYVLVQNKVKHIALSD